MKPYRQPLLDFASVSDGVDGVIWKAGLQSSVQTASGIGVNGTATGANIIFTDGGISTSDTNTGSRKVEITIPAAYQAGLRFCGRIQFDVKASDAVNIVTASNAKWSLRDAANAEQGPRIITNGSANIAGNQAAAYTQKSKYCVLALDATWSPNVFETTENSQSVYFTDDDPWVTLTVSWEGPFQTWLINGHTVGRSKHAAFTANPTYLRIELISTTLADRIPIRNLILCDHPAPDTHRYRGPNIPRVVCMGHSFFATGGGNLEWDNTHLYDSNERNGSLQHLASNIHKTYTEAYGPCNFKNLAHDGSVDGVAGVIAGHAASLTVTQKTWDWSNTEVVLNRILGVQPHFALLMLHGSDSSAATVDTNLTTILNALIANGIVPIVIREQNRDVGGTDNTAIDAQVVSTVATVLAANGTNSVGIVDMWTPTGGSTVNAAYVESGGGRIHPNLDVGPLYGAAVAAELYRLAKAPPTYAKWPGY